MYCIKGSQRRELLTDQEVPTTQLNTTNTHQIYINACVIFSTTFNRFFTRVSLLLYVLFSQKSMCARFIRRI